MFDMKKFAVLLCGAALLAGLTACGSSSDAESVGGECLPE